MGQSGWRKSCEKQQNHKQLQKSARTSALRKEQLERWCLGVFWLRKDWPERFNEKILIVTGLHITLQASIMEIIALQLHLSLDWPLAFLWVSWDPVWQRYQQMSLLILGLPVSLDLLPSGLVLMVSFTTDIKESQWCGSSQHQQINCCVLH